jgi:hypothetical protein
MLTGSRIPEEFIVKSGHFSACRQSDRQQSIVSPNHSGHRDASHESASPSVRIRQERFSAAENLHRRSHLEGVNRHKTSPPSKFTILYAIVNHLPKVANRQGLVTPNLSALWVGRLDATERLVLV